MTTDHGTRFIGPGVQSPRSRFSIFVEGLGKPTLAWLTVLESLKKRGFPGPWKRYSNTRTSGLNSERVGPMQAQVVVGFLMQSLNEGQRARLKAVWKKFPRGRYMIPCEAHRILGMEPKQTMVKDYQQAEMLKTWNDFCKQANEDQMSLPFDHETWFKWMDFSVRNYTAPMPPLIEGEMARAPW